MWVITICHSISPISVDADDDEEEEEDGEDDKDGVEVERVNHLNCWELSTWCRRCCKRHCKYIWVLIYLDYCFFWVYLDHFNLQPPKYILVLYITIIIITIIIIIIKESAWVLEKASVGESTRADKCVFTVHKYKLKRNN